MVFRSAKPPTCFSLNVAFTRFALLALHRTGERQLHRVRCVDAGGKLSKISQLQAVYLHTGGFWTMSTTLETDAGFDTYVDGYVHRPNFFGKKCVCVRIVKGTNKTSKPTTCPAAFIDYMSRSVVLSTCAVSLGRIPLGGRCHAHVFPQRAENDSRLLL